MKRTIGMAMACLVALGTAATVAQSYDDAAETTLNTRTAADSRALIQQAGTISRVYLIKIKPGMEAQWMDAAKKHVAWHRAQNDPWTWTGFYVETGKNTGMYGWITQNHQWSDFDTYDATIGPADGEDARSMGAFEESFTSSFTMSLPDMSNSPAAGATFSLVSVTHHTIDRMKLEAFMGAVSQAHGALQKGGFKGSYTWSTLVNGGENTVMTLALPLSNWAAMAEPEPSMARILTDALGQEATASLIQTFNGAIVATESWIARIIPDLTYVPGS